MQGIAVGPIPPAGISEATLLTPPNTASFWCMLFSSPTTTASLFSSFASPLPSHFPLSPPQWLPQLRSPPSLSPNPLSPTRLPSPASASEMRFGGFRAWIWRNLGFTWASPSDRRRWSSMTRCSRTTRLLLRSCFPVRSVLNFSFMMFYSYESRIELENSTWI